MFYFTFPLNSLRDGPGPYLSPSFPQSWLRSPAMTYSLYEKIYVLRKQSKTLFCNKGNPQNPGKDQMIQCQKNPKPNNKNTQPKTCEPMTLP